MGEQHHKPFQLSFNSSLRVDFQGSRVTSDGGLILVRELDERLGMGALIEQHLTDTRRGRNTQFPVSDLLRQSVYSRLAGYEDVNDAERVSADPTFRLIGSEKIWERGAALTSRLHSFETELLAEAENLAGLTAINRKLIGRAEAIESPRRVVLDMDSTEIPVYGQQEHSAYNGHFESICDHPLLRFNREGDCLAAKLRPGNVHSAEDWDERLLPEIERQRKRGEEVVFRADAAFAKPEIYEALEERGVTYAIRLPANNSLDREIAESQQTTVAQPAPASRPNTDPRRVRTIVEDLANKSGAKAVLFGLWLHDREVLTMALGDSMTTVPATTDMHYRIGGIAETFMSTLLLMLVEQGHISLDDTISRWFPNLLAADQVTVRMLVSNTAGYIDYVTVQDLLDLQLAEPFRTFTDDELINYSVRDRQMNFPPGTSWAYSHTDNVILGQVIQRATRRSMKQLYERHIFRPMRMRDTQFPTDQEIQSPVLHAFTRDRRFYEDCTYWNPSWGSTPGLPTSNLHDLGKWGPILGTGRLISPAHFQEQIAPTSVVGKGSNTPDLYFAFGFVVANGWIAQNPSINGYSGAFGYHLATGVTIVVEATKSETATTDAIAFDILREVTRYVTPATPINF